ncbi:MAG: LLM class flavin-dependent oxidoreductase [Dehalococcoidia bacterium]|nr:LLM class flavin-dependent oxidoreductase [Dehalococcoidia bacterium]
MKHISLYVNPQTTGPEHDLTMIRAVTQQIEYADHSGFSAVYLTEHHTTGYNAFSDPLLYAAYLAPKIRKMMMGFSVAVLPFHHPLRFATQCAMLDNLYEGRFVAGVGVGGGPLEYDAFGINLDEKREYMDEALEAVLGCWRGNYEHRGKHWNFKMERVIPAPYTKPHPKIARAVVSDASLVDTARRGWPVLLGRFPEERIKGYVERYRGVLENSGHDAATIQYCLDWITVLKLVYVADSDEQAKEEIRPWLVRYLIQSAKANSADYIGEEQAGEGVDEFIARAMIIGSPKTVAERIHAYGDVGITNMMIWTAFGEQPHDMVMRNMRLFTEEVMPRVLTPQFASAR